MTWSPQLPGLPSVGGMVRPSVPVDVPEPVGERPSPVSEGTITLLAVDGAGAGRPPSGATGAAFRGGADEEAEPAQVRVSTVNSPGPAQATVRRGDRGRPRPIPAV